MTTIVASFTERVMVSDSKTTDGNTKWKSSKLERVGDSIIGCAGDCVQIETFLRWYRAGRGRKVKLTDDFTALELNPDGLWMWDKGLVRYPPGIDHHAIGTGAQAALAAMLLGANAKRAVEIACEVDDGSEGPLQVEIL